MDFHDCWAFLPFAVSDLCLEQAAGQEVTERKRSEDEVKRLHRQNQLILNSVGEGVVGLDEKGTIIFANPAAREALGYEQDELIGRDLHLTIHHSFQDGTHYPVDDCPINHRAQTGRGGTDLWEPAAERYHRISP